VTVIEAIFRKWREGGRTWVKLSVIIPAYNGGEELDLYLKALAASTRPPDEIIVVDDTSTDASGALAAKLGATVLHLPDGPRGPARARNHGAAAAQGDVLVFLDADVTCHPDTLGRIKTYLENAPEVAALFGSYDADPSGPGLVSRYKNLLHHYIHQHGRPEASTSGRVVAPSAVTFSWPSAGSTKVI
jgi:glycosyltransferase involved in cell wall biosynthesis